MMSRKRYTAEQILGMVRKAEVRLSQGEKIGELKPIHIGAHFSQPEG
jgi:hypothetical protein